MRQRKTQIGKQNFDAKKLHSSLATLRKKIPGHIDIFYAMEGKTQADQELIEDISDKLYDGFNTSVQTVFEQLLDVFDGDKMRVFDIINESYNHFESGSYGKLSE
jgi:hypothetical protein